MVQVLMTAAEGSVKLMARADGVSAVQVQGYGVFEYSPQDLDLAIEHLLSYGECD